MVKGGVCGSRRRFSVGRTLRLQSPLVDQTAAPDPPVYLTSLWWLACTGGGGTKEPVIAQGPPAAGREVGLMYSFSSQSEEGCSTLAAAGRDLIEYGRHEVW